MSTLCFMSTGCPPEVSAAIIVGAVTCASVLINLVLTVTNFRSTRVHNLAVFQHSERLAHENREHEIRLEELRKTLDLAAETRRGQLHRLRELQRSAELTQQCATELSQWQESRDAPADDHNSEVFLSQAGEFLRAAAGIFTPASRGAPNLPSEPASYLQSLRRAVVKVNLLLEPHTGETPPTPARNQAMGAAVVALNEAVKQFVKSVDAEEIKPLQNVIGQGKKSN